DSRRRAPLAQRVVVEGPEVEKLVFDDRTANIASHKALIVPGLGERCSRRRLTLRRLIEGVQLPILKIFIHRAVNVVRAPLKDDIELAAGGVPEFRAELVLKN